MKRKKQIIVPLVILLIGAAGLFALTAMKKPPAEKEKKDLTPIVSVDTVNLNPLTLQVDSYGNVTPKYETTLVSQVSGEIIELSEAFVRGGFVAKGQLLAKIDSSDYDAALIDAQATMATAMAALETERAQGKVAEREWKQITDTSPTELSLRKPQLAKELARVKAGQAAVLRAQRNVERTQIRAPYDAMIESRQVGLGSFVGVGTTIGKLLGTDIAEVRLPVADNHLRFLHKQGAEAQVELSGLFAGKTTTWQAKIIRNEGVVDAKSRMNFLVAEIHDPYHLVTNKGHTVVNEGESPLRFGSYVTAKIKGISVEAAAILPQHLVVNNRVAIIDDELKLHYVDIDIVRHQGANVVVSSGLKQGDQLITSALDYPIEGMQLALSSNELELELEPEDESNESSKTQIASMAKE